MFTNERSAIGAGTDRPVDFRRRARPVDFHQGVKMSANAAQKIKADATGLTSRPLTLQQHESLGAAIAVIDTGRILRSRWVLIHL